MERWDIAELTSLKQQFRVSRLYSASLDFFVNMLRFQRVWLILKPLFCWRCSVPLVGTIHDMQLGICRTSVLMMQNDGTPEVTLEEFIEGIMRCKGQARAIDQATHVYAVIACGPRA